MAPGPAYFFHFLFQLWPSEMFSEKMEEAACGWVMALDLTASGIEDGSGWALGAPSPKPSPDSSHSVLPPGFPGEAWEEETGAGGD